MKKLTTILIFLTFTLSACAQTKSTMINNGRIFSKEYSSQYLPFESKSRFTPSPTDIGTVEALIVSQIADLNQDRLNQEGDCPIIDKRLKGYYRQYVGYVNDKGERTVWVNFLWKKEYKKSELADDIILVFDGCSYYWNIKVNLTRKMVYDLSINGSA